MTIWPIGSWSWWNINVILLITSIDNLIPRESPPLPTAPRATIVAKPLAGFTLLDAVAVIVISSYAVSQQTRTSITAVVDVGASSVVAWPGATSVPTGGHHRLGQDSPQRWDDMWNPLHPEIWTRRKYSLPTTTICQNQIFQYVKENYQYYSGGHHTCNNHN